jgi:hypothetical protein
MTEEKASVEATAIRSDITNSFAFSKYEIHVTLSLVNSMLSMGPLP